MTQYFRLQCTLATKEKGKDEIEVQSDFYYILYNNNIEQKKIRLLSLYINTIVTHINNVIYKYYNVTKIIKLYLFIKYQLT